MKRRSRGAHRELGQVVDLRSQCCSDTAMQLLGVENLQR